MEEVKFLLLTIAVEALVALLLLRRREPAMKVLLVTLFVNMISHPIAWQLIEERGVNWLLVEFLVAAFEALVFAWLFAKSRTRAVFTAIFMNVVTAAIGLLIS